MASLYGWAVVRPEPAVRFVFIPPTRWQSFKMRAREQWDYVILPSLIFSVSYTALEIACKYG